MELKQLIGNENVNLRRMSDRMSGDKQRMPDRSQKECQKMSHILFVKLSKIEREADRQKICKTECWEESQKMCQKDCQKRRQEECQRICQKECQTECQEILAKHVRQNVRRDARMTVRRLPTVKFAR